MKDNHLSPVVYGITACDTVKKARAWLSDNGLAYDFVDFKKTPPTSVLLHDWLSQVPWNQLINRKGTTWRKLPLATQEALCDDASALKLAMEFPSVIKRPIVKWPDGAVTVGFEPAVWEARCSPPK